MIMAEAGGWRLGVDVGGTFTDLVLLSPDGRATTRKVLSSTANYADAILQGVRELLANAGITAKEIAELIHGTTVATNRS
jgi:N-methylhydantoinase A